MIDVNPAKFKLAQSSVYLYRRITLLNFTNDLSYKLQGNLRNCKAVCSRWICNYNLQRTNRKPVTRIAKNFANVLYSRAKIKCKLVSVQGGERSPFHFLSEPSLGFLSI